ncbi:MAG: ribonuclease H-like domain-containing protein [Treponema sp.]|nr:ribonuclease H-like domain-containing protein [Treponema sp.]
MASNLRDRLRRIQDIKKIQTNAPAKVPAAVNDARMRLIADGWSDAGFLTFKKNFQLTQHINIPPVFPAALPVVIPDMPWGAGFDTAGHSIGIEDLLFFDLETTGLSGGAGTVAFLAAFGRLVRITAHGKTATARGKAVSEPGYNLQITQYLLLDYPGEGDFLAALTPEFTATASAPRPVVVSFNGKSFDAAILATRCLMNGIKPPVYLHADLLHPARRLWKRLLENCSQGTIEEKLLGLDRSDDVSGAMAPDIWFDFLRTGKTGDLMAICEHNRRDIRGLASIFAVMARIADDPFAAFTSYPYDTENLALRWHDCTRRMAVSGWNEKRGEYAALLQTGTELLEYAAARGGGRAALVLALLLLRGGSEEKGRKKLAEIASGDLPMQFRISALRFLAIDSEHYLSDYATALEYVNRALDLDLSGIQRADFEYRRNRLAGKMGLR